jgi:hypothetical protein
VIRVAGTHQNLVTSTFGASLLGTQGEKIRLKSKEVHSSLDTNAVTFFFNFWTEFCV